MATMVRIKAETHQRLQRIAKNTKRTLPDVLDEAIRSYEKQRFLQECDAAYVRLREDTSAWQEETEERTVWENTLGDGLEDDEYAKEKPDANALRTKTPAATRIVKPRKAKL